MQINLGVRKTDVGIAAITLENAGILVTRNLRDFQRVPNRCRKLGRLTSN